VAVFEKRANITVNAELCQKYHNHDNSIFSTVVAAQQASLTVHNEGATMDEQLMFTNSRIIIIFIIIIMALDVTDLLKIR